jgi:hypothetical protein
MTSKYEMAARARKKKRKVSQLGKAKASATGLGAAARAAKQSRYAKAFKEGMKTKRKLTPAEQRRMKVLGAKATTAKRKLAVQEMDKRIAKIKKER